MAVTGRNDPQAVHAPVARRWAGSFLAERRSTATTRSRGWGRLWELAHQPLTWPVATFVGAFAIAFLRRPETLTRAQFFNEDGQIFYLGTWFSAPWTPYAGYLHLFPRLAAYLERAVPVAAAPLVGNLIALAVTAGVAAFIASDAMPGPRGMRIAIGLFVVLSPLSWEVAGSLTYAQWYLAIFLVAVLFARLGKGWLPVVAIAGLTGPFLAILAPLYVARWWRDRAFRAFAMTAIACAAIQAIAFLMSPRVVNAPIGVDFLHDAALRLVVAPVLGTLALSLPVLPIAALLLVGVVAAAAFVPWRLLAVVVYVWLALGFVGIVLRPDGGKLWELLDDGRYFFLPATALGIVAIVGAWYGRRWILPIALAGAMAVGVVSGFRLDPRPDSGWPAGAACIGGSTPCVAAVYPRGWDIRWPGAAGTYDPNWGVN